ncbi:exopolysaccharide transport family protein [Ciceribacter lividus]|uniref:Exopolysaccharide transport family protein n=1 Tax=Ciceribacter lividus TaxID=1197950 RepID=A0A6I7HS25_9HYPH|nr:exopolysaccharide transport family protein [Ciceribacter lividus]RCW27759.1 exopolysaccharide transport family protein [Ciceribacter lividus]
MSSVGNSRQDEDIDLAQLFRAVWQRKGRILAATALAAGLAFAGANAISPRYQAETRILIEAREPNFMGQGANSADLQPLLDELNIASQVQMLRSVDLIKQVARDLKLYEREEFDPVASPSATDELLILLGLKKNPLERAPEDRVVDTFLEKLSVYQVERSRVIAVAFTSKDPELAAAIPNAMVDVYLSLQRGAKLDSNSQAARWLEPEIANLREKVKEAEQKVADYRAAHDIVQTSDTGTFSGQQLNDISAELARVRSEMADAEAKAENVRAALAAGRPADMIDAVVSNATIQRLKESEAGVRAQISELSITLLDGHPRIKALRAQLAGIRQQIASETSNVAASLENDASVARLREKQLVAKLNMLKADYAQADSREVGLRELEREAAAQRQLLETYLSRYREATTRLESAASPADARVISKASEPIEPDFPKVIPITIVAALAVLVLSVVIVMLTELFSGRAFKPADGNGNGPDGGRDRERLPEREHDRYDEPQTVRPRRDLPANLLSVAPDKALTAEMEEVLDLPPAPAAAAPAVDDKDEFSIESVAGYLVTSGVRTALAISPTGDDGSTATVMLAREIAEGGRHVVLIDMTGSGCPTTLMASRKDLSGITDLLSGTAAFGDTIHPDRLSSAHIVPKGNSDIRRAMRGADRLSMITDALAEAYDLVIVECGPANAEGVARLSRNHRYEIILSAPRPDMKDLAAIMDEFEKVGYADLVLMTAGGLQSRDERKRSAA